MAQENGPELARLTCSLPGYGRVLLYDDMEGVLKWGVVDGLTSGLPFKSQLWVYQGNYAMRIGAWVDFPNGWNWRYAGRSVGLRGHKHVRVSVVFCSRALTIADGFRLWLRYYDGTYRWQGSHQYNFGPDDRGWHCLSLEVDFSLGVYVGGWVDGVDLGLGGSALASVVDASPEVFYVIMGVGSDALRAKYVGFDLVLVQEV